MRFLKKKKKAFHLGAFKKKNQVNFIILQYYMHEKNCIIILQIFQILPSNHLSFHESASRDCSEKIQYKRINKICVGQ